MIPKARAIERSIAGLLADQTQRALLEDTLVVWRGGFGRTPTTEGKAVGEKRGRDHSPVRGGQVIGATDELGFVPVDRPLSPSDIHDTVLHALGLDQRRTIFSHNNRDEIPTVFVGEVEREVFG